MALKRDFNLYDAFKVFDIKQRGYVTQIDFETALKYDLRVYASDEEMSLLFKKFDKNRDGVISYVEFIKGVLPESK